MLADRIRDKRTRDAVYAAESAADLAGIRGEAALLLGSGTSASAVSAALTDMGIHVGESLIRRWAAEVGRTPVRPVPEWWEVIDHRPADVVRAEIETAIGMTVQVDGAPCYVLALTPAQVETLRAAIPGGTVMGPLDETCG
jgi:hypothetical protein